MKKSIILIIATLAIASLAIAHGPHGHGDGYAGQENVHLAPFARMLADVELSVDQHNQIRNIRAKYQKQNIPLRSEINVWRLEMKEELREHNYAEAKKIVAKIHNQQALIEKNLIDMRKELWETLTPEQQKQAEEAQYKRTPGKDRMFRDFKKIDK